MTLSENTRAKIDNLAHKVLQHYDLKSPPVPIERILSEPPDQLEKVDISDLSLVFGIGEDRYEYRMALGRLLYRELCRTGLGGEDVPYSGEAAHVFARAVLAPAKWLVPATQRPSVTLHTLSEEFQLPAYAITSRLVELDLQVAGID